MRVERKTYVMIAAGGTGGHVFPGIALAEERKGQAPKATVVFAGTERGMEARIIPKRGFPLILLRSHSIKDKRGLAKLASAVMIPLSIMRSIAIMISERPQVFIGIGGYAAGPLSIAAWITRVPVVLIEPNAIPGMTNRILKRFAKRIFVSFVDAKEALGSKAVLTGTPVRREILEVRHGERHSDERMRIFVFGGSQGARSINRAMVEALRHLGDTVRGISVIHQTGSSDDAAGIAKAYEDAGVSAEVFPFTDRIWECYERTDLVVARAGANTVAELSALGIPSILVPYPYAADDHQRANALCLARAGGAVVISDKEFTGERVASEIRSLIEDADRLESMRRGALGFGRPDAARNIARESLAFTGS